MPWKASELITKLCGWSEPENARSININTFMSDASLISELRAGYSALTAHSKPGLELAASPPTGGAELPQPKSSRRRGQVLDPTNSAREAAFGGPKASKPE